MNHSFVCLLLIVIQSLKMSFDGIREEQKKCLCLVNMAIIIYNILNRATCLCAICLYATCLCPPHLTEKLVVVIFWMEDHHHHQEQQQQQQQQPKRHYNHQPVQQLKLIVIIIIHLHGSFLRIIYTSLSLLSLLLLFSSGSVCLLFAALHSSLS